MIKFLSSLLLLIFISAPTIASKRQRQLQQLTTQFLSQHGKHEHFSALAISVKLPGHKKIISTFAGTTSFRQPTPITAESLFQIGSISKSFIAVILLQLTSQPQYHIKMDDPITKFFPEYPKWQSISIRQLLNMTSGIPDYFQDKKLLADFTREPFKRHQRTVWLDYIYQKPLRFIPGTKFDYSNTNYFLLGLLIEKITGHALSSEIKNRIIRPFHLTHTYFVPHLPSNFLKQHLVHGYQHEKGYAAYIPLGSDVTAFSLSYLNAAGALISTSADIAKWTNVLFTAGKILPRNQFKELTTLISEKNAQKNPQLSSDNAQGYGLGISQQYSENLRTTFYIYQGMTFGYRAIYVYIPKNKMLITAVVNSSSDGKPNHLLDLINQIGAIAHV